VPSQQQRPFEILYDRATDIAVATISHQESMDRPSLSQLPATQTQDRRLINRLLVFFALVYVVEGVGEVGGLLEQPLSFYLKQAHGWSALQVSAYLTIFNFPWIIKPIYGAVSDFVPLFGYRRKPYLLVANLIATSAFFWVTRLTAPGQLAWALQLTAYTMAISSAVCGALLVENGQRLGESGKFVNQQWLWLNAATVFASIAGGELAERLPPTSALHVAAAMVALAPLAVVFGTAFLIPEKKTHADFPDAARQFRQSRDRFPETRTLGRRDFPFSLLLQPGPQYAALLLHDRRSQFIPGLYRRSRID
jgi:hypothetical protein